VDDESLEVERGMNRFVWDLRYPAPDVIEGARFSLAYTGGAWAPPGEYRIRVSTGAGSRTVTATVEPDPRKEAVTRADLEAQFDLTLQVRARLSQVHDAVREIRSIREQARGLVASAEELDHPEETVEELAEAADALDEALSAVEEELIQTRSESGQDPINFPPKLDDQLAYLYSHVTNSYGRPTEGAYERYRDLVEETEPHLRELERIVEEEVGALNRRLAELEVGPVVTRR
jgi:hypothetical protein